MNLSENSDTFKFVNEIRTNFSEKNIIKKTTKNSAIIFKALERNFFSNVVGSIHLWSENDQEKINNEGERKQRKERSRVYE